MADRGGVNQAKSAAALRSPALRSVLQVVRLQTATTRREVVEQTGLTVSVVARAIRDLIDCGLLEYAEATSSTGGRAARCLQLPKGSSQVLARAEAALPLDYSPKEALTQIDRAYRRICLERQCSTADLVSVGVSLPGAVARGDDERVVASSLHPDWLRFPLQERLLERFECPVSLENDVKAVALAELRAGSLRGTNCGLVVKLDAGVGAGITVGDWIHRGTQGWAGDLGHICVDEEHDARCHCGNRGCLEAFVGTDAALGAATAAAEAGESELLAACLETRGRITMTDIASCASRGDQAVLRILQNASELVGKVLATTVNILNPDVIVLSGSLVTTEAFLSGVRAKIYQHSHPFATRHLIVERSAFGAAAGLLGAVWLALDHYFISVLPPEDAPDHGRFEAKDRAFPYPRRRRTTSNSPLPVPLSHAPRRAGAAERPQMNRRSARD